METTTATELTINNVTIVHHIEYGSLYVKVYRDVSFYQFTIITCNLVQIIGNCNLTSLHFNSITCFLSFKIDSIEYELSFQWNSSKTDYIINISLAN